MNSLRWKCQGKSDTKHHHSARLILVCHADVQKQQRASGPVSRLVQYRERTGVFDLEGGGDEGRPAAWRWRIMGTGERPWEWNLLNPTETNAGATEAVSETQREKQFCQCVLKKADKSQHICKSRLEKAQMGIRASEKYLCVCVCVNWPSWACSEESGDLLGDRIEVDVVETGPRWQTRHGAHLRRNTANKHTADQKKKNRMQSFQLFRRFMHFILFH